MIKLLPQFDIKNNPQWLILVAALVGLFIVVLLILVETTLLVYAAGAIFAVILLGLCITSPHLMFILFILYILLQDLSLYIVEYGLRQASIMDWGDEFILIGLTLNWVVRILLRNRKFIRTPVDIPIALFLLYYVLSALLNSVPVANAVLGFRDSLFYVLLLYAIVQLRFKPDFISRLIVWVFRFAILELSVLLIQWAVFIARTGSFSIEDEAVGLMGPNGSHKLGYFAGILLMAYLGFYREGVYKKKGIIFALMAIVGISSTRAALLYIPVVATLIFWERILKNRKLLLYWIGTLSFFALIVLGYELVGYNAPIDPRLLYQQQMREQLGGRYTRTAFIRYSWELLEENDALLWGVGPGWYAGKTASRLGSPYYQNLPEGAQPQLSQIALTLGEYGIVGSSLIVLIYTSMFFFVWRMSRKNQDPYLRGIATATMGILLFFGLGMVSNSLFEIQQVAFLPWLFGGSCVALYVEQKKSINSPQIEI